MTLRDPLDLLHAAAARFASPRRAASDRPASARQAPSPVPARARALALAFGLGFTASALAQSAAPAAPAAAPARAAATGATNAADPVLIGNAVAQVRVSDYEIELQRLPADVRAGFGNNKRRIQELVSSLLITKTLAAQALAMKLDQDPETAARLRSELERFYSGARLVAMEKQVLAEFEAKKPGLEARARELYAVNPKKYDTPDEASVSHILFSLAKHPKDEGLKLAQETRARILAGADFNAVAKEVSDDGSAKTNSGRIGYIPRENLDAAFADAAYKMRKVGEVSEPVFSSFGWHLIKLDARKPGGPKPWAQTRDEIFLELIQQQVAERRDALLNSINNDPAAFVNQAAVDALYIAPEPLPADIKMPKVKKKD